MFLHSQAATAPTAEEMKAIQKRTGAVGVSTTWVSKGVAGVLVLLRDREKARAAGWPEWVWDDALQRFTPKQMEVATGVVWNHAAHHIFETMGLTKEQADRVHEKLGNLMGGAARPSNILQQFMEDPGLTLAERFYGVFQFGVAMDRSLVMQRVKGALQEALY